jgi:hypothetical protein
MQKTEAERQEANSSATNSSTSQLVNKIVNIFLNVPLNVNIQCTIISKVTQPLIVEIHVIQKNASIFRDSCYVE